VDMGILNVLVGLTGITSGFFLIPMNAISFLAAVTNSYYWNKFWTFQSQGNVYKESIFFLLVFLVCYIIQLSVLYYLHGIRQYNENLSQLISMVVYTLANFLLNKFLTFK
ncbi:MAG: GtrA family protein, partial [Leptonema sp. (in: bacteria)]